MSRLSVATRDKIPEKEAGLFDEIVKELGSVPSHGPRSVLAYVPKAFKLEQELRDYLLKKSTLSNDVIELVILVVARELDCQYIWNSHAGLARKAGVSNDLVDALRDRKDLPEVSDKHLAVIHYGREIFRTHTVSAGTFGLVAEQFGERGLVEVALMFGDYCMLAVLVNSMDLQLRADRSEPIMPIC